MIYLLDTNIILMLMSDPTFEAAFTVQYIKENNVIAVSTVVVGELLAIAKVRQWGERRKLMLEQRLVSLLVIPINRTDIHAAYAEIQAYSQGKIATKPLGQSARNMGKNDLWIAATTHVLEASLLTADKDFQHLDQVYFPLELIER